MNSLFKISNNLSMANKIDFNFYCLYIKIILNMIFGLV
jgi:hypothetical protein